MYKILLVEDETEILELNKEMLERRGSYTVSLATNLTEAKKAVAQLEPDIIVLDIMLPDGNGLDFLLELRQDRDIPVLILSGLGSLQDRLAGLKAGGDVYLPKPYDNEELVLNIEAILRRSDLVPDTLVKGPLKLELFSNNAYLNEKRLFLTQRDFDILFLLVQNEDKILKAEYIYETIWARPMAGDKNAIQAAISKLRKKIEHSGYDIKVIRGKGYVFTQLQ